MLARTRNSIRRIFLSRHLNVSEATAAALLGCSVAKLRREVADGEIVAASTPEGVRIPRSELISAAFRTWTHGAIEEALAGDADRVLPDALRLTELRARVPRYQRDMLKCLARREHRSMDDVLARHLEDLASACSEELTPTVLT